MTGKAFPLIGEWINWGGRAVITEFKAVLLSLKPEHTVFCSGRTTGSYCPRPHPSSIPTETCLNLGLGIPGAWKNLRMQKSFLPAGSGVGWGYKAWGGIDGPVMDAWTLLDLLGSVVGVQMLHLSRSWGEAVWLKCTKANMKFPSPCRKGHPALEVPPLADLWPCQL